MQQRTEEWFLERLGKFTGSRFKDLMATTKSGPAASRQNLIGDLAAERFLGRPVTNGFQTAAMARGIELEAAAREAYELRRALLVREEAFINHPDVDFIGVSPDGLVDEDPEGPGIIEIKCPTVTQKHLAALLDGRKIPKGVKLPAPPSLEYTWQIQGQLMTAGRNWCDVVSYHPDFGEHSLAITRVYPNQDAIQQLFRECIKANDQVDLVVLALREGLAA